MSEQRPLGEQEKSLYGVPKYKVSASRAKNKANSFAFYSEAQSDFATYRLQSYTIFSHSQTFCNNFLVSRVFVLQNGCFFVLNQHC